MLEICLVPITSVASQYPGLYIFSTPARMMRPVLNLAASKVEMIGTFEQVRVCSNIHCFTLNLNNCPYWRRESPIARLRWSEIGFAFSSCG